MPTKHTENKRLAQSEASARDSKTAYNGLPWRPERSSLTRIDFKKIILDLMG